MVREQVRHAAHERFAIKTVEPRYAHDEVARANFRNEFLHIRLLVTVDRKRSGFIGFGQQSVLIAVEDVIRAVLHKQGALRRAAPCQIERSVAIDLGGFVRVLFARVEIANSCRIDHHVPALRKQPVELTGVCDIRLLVCQSRQVMT